MSELLFYEKLVALNRERHKKLRLKALDDGFAFSAGVNSVPLAGIEFFEASRDMTVLFKKGDDGRFFPVVMMSLSNSGHELVDVQGNWQGSYVPAFIRRYPFALAADGTVCVDEKSQALSESEGELLFTESGQSESLEKVLAFLRQFDTEMRRTRDFCDALAQKGLLAPFEVEVRPRDGGRPVRLQGLHAVNTQKFSELRGDTLELWFTKSWVAWIYAHLHSIGALGKLSSDKAPPSRTH
ncbi:SapC protein [Hylemonella gracilis str. Niagara R]|uniref:SapC protein n=1 Tax=Hylemonella gracilis str. Niagara R TaxID=1458275 RepID=A0A016XFI7_9BURK|nr:SapC family protein [Hylemonella gracilis]EYC50670.1 SapC protein [Hylemonella gracilis str. Niagara R]